MTDNRFKWLTGCVVVAVVAIAGMVIFSPDKPTAKPAKEKSGLGEYVYVDNRKIVHADRKCSRLNYKGVRSERYPVHEFKMDEYGSYCPKCVSDEDYEALQQIVVSKN